MGASNQFTGRSKKKQRARGNQEDGEGDAQEVEGRNIQLEEVGWRWHRRRKASGTWAEEGGQLGAFSASLSQQAFTPASGSIVFIGKIERLRFCWWWWGEEPNRSVTEHFFLAAFRF